MLDATVFYPGGGGQPSDSARCSRAADGRRWTVRAARKLGGEIVHELEVPDGGAPPERGDIVRVDLDWARRYALMRTHTALHALCGVVWRDYGALVTGGNMEPGGGRMDFEFERMTGDLVDEIEARVNAELAAAREVRVDVMPRDDAFAIPDLIRTKVNLLPAGIEEIRTDRDRGAGPPGRRRDARGEYARGRRHQGHRLRIEGPDQQTAMLPRTDSSYCCTEPTTLLLGHTDTGSPRGALSAQNGVRLERESTLQFVAGFFDMKASCVVAIEALHCLTALSLRPHRPVTLLLTCDEEIGSPTGRAFVEREAGRAAQVLVLKTPPVPGGCVKTGRKGVGGWASFSSWGRFARGLASGTRRQRHTRTRATNRAVAFIK